MRGSGGWLFAVVVGCTALGPVGCSSADAVDEHDPPTLAEISARLQGALDAWADAPGHRGVSAAVVLADGEMWVGTAGIEATGKALEPDHLIAIASITKTMTGAVVLQLAEEGALGLDDPISAWLPAILNVDPHITIRQLLNHTNGLANYTASPALGSAIDANPGHRFTAAELLTYLGPSAFAPGVRTQYTNTAFLLLGMIAEAAADRPITELWQERPWAPLRLTGVFLPGVQDPPGPVATAWAGQGASTAVEPRGEMALLTIGQSAFGLFADASVVARWGHALVAGSVLDTETRSQMLELVPAAGNIPGESGAGLGIRSYAYLGRTQYGHSGGSSLGSSSCSSTRRAASRSRCS